MNPHYKKQRILSQRLGLVMMSEMVKSIVARMKQVDEEKVVPPMEEYVPTLEEKCYEMFKAAPEEQQKAMLCAYFRNGCIKESTNAVRMMHILEMNSDSILKEMAERFAIGMATLDSGKTLDEHLSEENAPRTKTTTN